MTLFKDMCNQLTMRNALCLLCLVALAVILMRYNGIKGASLWGLTNVKERNGNEEVNPGVQPAEAAGMNSVPAGATAVQQLSSNVPENFKKQQVTNPADLLPKDSNSEWGALNPAGAGELTGVNLLKSGHHSGIDTKGSSLRNSNLQLRDEPPNPRAVVSPWGNSVLDTHQARRSLE